MGNSNVKVEGTTVQVSASARSHQESENDAGSIGDKELPSRSRKTRYSFVYNGSRVEVKERELVAHMFPVFYTDQVRFFCRQEKKRPRSLHNNLPGC